MSRGGITKTGNTAARRVLVEAAWTYRFPARISREQCLRQEARPKPIREIAWKAQLRLCARYRKLALARKPANVVTTAIARELAGFVWAIARRVSPIQLTEGRVIINQGRRQRTSCHPTDGQGGGRGHGEENPRIH